MLQFLNQKRGQSTLEYAVLIVIIIGALLTIQVYVKRGVQGRLKSAADDIGDQYSDGNENSIKHSERSGGTEETFNAGTSYSNIIGQENSTSYENTIMLNTQSEYWGTNSGS